MAKFKITVTKTSEYEIDVDESIWTPHEIQDWAKTFYPTEDAKEFAEHLASAVSNETGFMEGFGVVKRTWESGDEVFQGKDVEYEKGLNVIIVNENDMEIETETIV